MRSISAILFVLVLYMPNPAWAQRQASICQAIANYQEQNLPIRLASTHSAVIASDEVRITYVGHSTFRIESAGKVSILTDYNGALGFGGPPDIATMNHAHDSHYTSYPDEGIKHVLKGWNPDGGAAKHNLVVEDVYIRNVPTDIYNGGVLIEEDGNSIFVFEIAGLCIGHLGHLHHSLTPSHIAEIGRLDVIFAAVDGSYTISQEGMAEIARKLRASIMFPMHYFSSFSLGAFLEEMKSDFAISISNEPSMTISLRTLPNSPTVIVLPPG